MAGGPSTVDLVAAAGRAGALGFLAGGYKTAAGLAEEMAAVRAAGAETFGVNLFVPGAPTTDPEGLAAYLGQLETDAAVVGVALGEAAWDDDDYAGKVDAVLAAPPAAVSFTFGIPAVEVVRALQAAGSAVLLTVTTPEEADVALRVGPDGLCLQGAEAGAHRGSLTNGDRPDEDRPLRALLAAVRRRTLVPLVAAGGVGTAGGRGRSADARGRPGAGRHGVPALSRERRARRTEGRPGDERRLRGDRGHPCLQRSTGARAREHHGARASRCARRLPRDQQRDPSAAGQGSPGG